MRIYLEKNDGSVEQPGSLEGIEPSGARLLWVDLEKPSEKQIIEAGRLVNAHPVAMQYCSRPDSPPKVQEYPDNLFVTWSFLKPGTSSDIETAQVCIFLTERVLITVHDDHIDGIDDIFKKLNKDPDLYEHQPGEIMYAILNNAVDAFFPVIEDITGSIETYQDQLLAGTADAHLKTIIDQKNRNVRMRKTVAAHRDVILKLERRDMPFIPRDTAPYVMDIYDLLSRASTEVDANSDQITSSMDIDLNIISNRLNNVMKKLTIVATIFLPLTFLVGLYGMNFKHMPELSWRYGYLFAWLFMLVVGILTYFFAKWFIERPSKRGTGDDIE